MVEFTFKDRYGVYDLAEIVKALRSEGGCPWDKEQTHASIRNNFLEEVYEAIEAIDIDNKEMMREELGDVLLQVVFHSVMETEAGSFDLDDIADEVCKKLIERHPHVFGSVKVSGTDDVLTNWESIKQKSKGQESATDTLKSVPKVFPALMRAQKLGKRAARAGVDFGCDKEDGETELTGAIRRVLRQVESDIADGKEPDANIGNLLMLCANLARRCGCDAEQALADACGDFIDRFEEIEKSGRNLNEVAAGEIYSY